MEAQACEKDDDLEQVMRRLAAGDEAAVVTLYERYGSSIAAAVRHVARSRPGRLDDDDVGGAVLDVCFELARVAGGWSPAGGALPWVWARHRVAGAVDRALGQQAQSLDDQRSEVALDRVGAGAGPGPAAPEASLLDTLNRLAAQDAASRRPAPVDAAPSDGVRPGPAGEAPVIDPAVALAANRLAAQDTASREPALVDVAASDGVRPGPAGEAPAIDPAVALAANRLAAQDTASREPALVDVAASDGVRAGPAGEAPANDPGVAPAPDRPSAQGPASDGSPAELSLVGSRRAPAAGGLPCDPIPVVPASVRARVDAPERVDLTDSPDAPVGVGLLAEAMDRGGVSVRDRELLLEYAYEKHSGNGAPAASVAPMFDMREVSVRQAARRTRERLLRLAASEERFAPLADLPLLA